MNAIRKSNDGGGQKPTLEELWRHQRRFLLRFSAFVTVPASIALVVITLLHPHPDSLPHAIGQFAFGVTVQGLGMVIASVAYLKTRQAIQIRKALGKAPSHLSAEELSALIDHHRRSGNVPEADKLSKELIERAERGVN